MRRKLRLLLVAALFGTVVYGDDITFQLGDGRILIKDVRFIRENVSEGGSLVPELSFTIINETSLSWRSVKLEFDMSGICGSEPRQWSRSVFMSLGWTQQEHYAKEFKDTIIALVGKVDGCRTETIKARLLTAEKVGAAEAVDQGIRDAAEAARQKRSPFFIARMSSGHCARVVLLYSCGLVAERAPVVKNGGSAEDLTAERDAGLETSQGMASTGARQIRLTVLARKLLTRLGRPTVGAQS